MKFDKNKLKYFISPLIVLGLLIIVFILNKVYPFGENTISNGDMGKAYTPIYYYMWDVFHGKANLFINFNVGMGTNMYDLTSVYGILSPFSWLIALTERSNIPNFLSYLLILKLCFMSVTSFILFDNCYKKLDLFWKVFFSVIYALSGWVIVYHTNFVWLDNVALFPLLILGMKRIIDKGDYRLYSVILFLSLCFSYYISYMEILFVIFSSFGYLKLFCDKEEKKKVIFKLGLGTVLAMGMSAVFWVPVLIQSLDSARVGQEWSMGLITFIQDKLMIVVFYGLPIILFLFMLVSKKTIKKHKKFALFMFLIMCSGVFLAPINAMWHTGTYAFFPFRYGFIVVMVLYLGALYYLNNNPNLNFKFSKVSFCSIGLLFVVLIILFIKYVPILARSNPAVYLSNIIIVYYLYLILGISTLLVIYLILIKNLKLKRTFLCLFMIISIVGFALGYVGLNESDIGREDSDITLFESNQLYDFLKNDSNDFNRYKNLNNNFIDNYPFISNKSSVSSWHMVDSASSNILKKLGYYVYFTQISEKEGTLFSDNLLGINRYISDDNLDSRIYNLVDSNNEFNLYELNNYLGYGFVYNQNDNFDDVNNSVDFQNNIYKGFFQKEDNILDNVSYLISKEENMMVTSDICSSSDGGEVVFEVKVIETSKLYFYYDLIDYILMGSDENNQFIKFIKVNGEYFYNPTVNEKYNNTFISEDGFIDLGLYDNETVEVTIGLSKNLCINNFKFVSLDINKLNSLIQEYKSDVNIKQISNKLVIDVYADTDDKSLFLPLNYLNGYEAILNNNDISVNKVLDNFVSIDLEKGDNTIILTYYPPYFKICLIISLIMFILFIIFLKFKFNKVNNVILNIFMGGYYLVFIVMFFYVYILGFLRL